MQKKLTDQQEIALRHFLDADEGKIILDFLVGRIVETQRRSMLSLSVGVDEASEKRFIIERHQLTGAELLQRKLFVDLEKFCRPAKSE